MYMPKTQHIHQTLAVNSTGYNIFNDVDNDAVVPKQRLFELHRFSVAGGGSCGSCGHLWL